MKIKYFKPASLLLQQYIHRFWSWEHEVTGAPIKLPAVIPTPLIELVFNYGSPSGISDSYNNKTNLTRGHVIGLRNEIFTFDTQQKVGFIAVRFRIGAFAHFCSIPLSEFTNRFVDLYEIWGSEGNDLEEKIIAADSFDIRSVVLEEYLLKFLKKYNKYEKRLQGALSQVTYGKSNFTKDSLADLLNISGRQLERCFNESIGVGPKLFQKIVRFDEVTRNLSLTGKSEYLPLALDAGYYDQSHFIKEFNSFTGNSPGNFFNKIAPMSHFYNID